MSRALKPMGASETAAVPGNTTPTASRPASPFPPFDAGLESLLHGLLDRARPNLSDADLRHVAERQCEALALMQQMASVCDGLGGLILADGQGRDVAEQAGSFQRADAVSTLVWLLGSVAQHAAAHLSIAQAADVALFCRQGSEGVAP